MDSKKKTVKFFLEEGSVLEKNTRASSRCYFENAQKIFIVFYLQFQVKPCLQLHPKEKTTKRQNKFFGD